MNMPNEQNEEEEEHTRLLRIISFYVFISRRVLQSTFYYYTFCSLFLGTCNLLYVFMAIFGMVGWVKSTNRPFQRNNNNNRKEQKEIMQRKKKTTTTRGPISWAQHENIINLFDFNAQLNESIQCKLLCYMKREQQLRLLVQWRKEKGNKRNFTINKMSALRK